MIERKKYVVNDSLDELITIYQEIVKAVAQMLESIGPEDAEELLRIERKIMKI